MGLSGKELRLVRVIGRLCRISNVFSGCSTSGRLIGKVILHAVESSRKDFGCSHGRAREHGNFSPLLGVYNRKEDESRSRRR